MKRCCGCKETKPYNEFHKNKLINDGYNFYCKECRSAHMSDYYVRNRQKRIDYSKRYLKRRYKEDPVYRDKVKAKLKILKIKDLLQDLAKQKIMIVSVPLPLILGGSDVSKLGSIWLLAVLLGVSRLLSESVHAAGREHNSDELHRQPVRRRPVQPVPGTSRGRRSRCFCVPR